MPKWMSELYQLSFYFEKDDSEKFDEILARINNLLGRAMMDTDDEVLYEDIRKELGDDETN